MNKPNESELSKDTQQTIQEIEKDDQLRKETIEDLKTNKIYKEFFAPYNAQSVEQFIKLAASHKSRLYQSEQYYLTKMEEMMSGYKAEAMKCLWLIQRKKLFDAYCLWLAEKAKFPEVKCSFDFKRWEFSIENCPILSPISDEEFDVLREYVNSGRFVPHKFEYWDTQLDEMRKALQNPDAHPLLANPVDWHLFFSQAMGVPNVHELPDLRKPKEDKYIKLARKKRQQHPPKPYVPDPRPKLEYSNEKILEFAKEFEDGDTAELIAATLRERHNPIRHNHLETALLLLREAKKPVPVSPNDDWQEAIFEAAISFLCENISTTLPVAYRDYKDHIKKGIPFPIEHSSSVDDIADLWRKDIIEGRKLAGEPADWDF